MRCGIRALSPRGKNLGDKLIEHVTKRNGSGDSNGAGHKIFGCYRENIRTLGEDFEVWKKYIVGLITDLPLVTCCMK